MRVNLIKPYYTDLWKYDEIHYYILLLYTTKIVFNNYNHHHNNNKRILRWTQNVLQAWSLNIRMHHQVFLKLDLQHHYQCQRRVRF